MSVALLLSYCVLTVIYFMYVFWDNTHIRIPSSHWWHRCFSDTSVCTGWKRTHRHRDTPGTGLTLAQLQSSLSPHGSSESSPLSLQSVGIYPCLGLCCEASVNTCNTLQEQNYSPHQVGFSHQCQYFSTCDDKQGGRETETWESLG